VRDLARGGGDDVAAVTTSEALGFARTFTKEIERGACAM
jgi:hypothetical protein